MARVFGQHCSKTSNKSIFSIINRLGLSIVVCIFLQVSAMGESHDKRHFCTTGILYSPFHSTRIGLLDLHVNLVSVVEAMLKLLYNVESKSHR